MIHTPLYRKKAIGDGRLRPRPAIMPLAALPIQNGRHRSTHQTAAKLSINALH